MSGNEITTEVKQSSTPSLLAKVASKYSVDPDKMLTTLKNTAFKVKGQVSNEQMMALLIVADQHNLNPWTKEIYAFEDKNKGIIPIVGVDGWARIINDHVEFDGMAFDQDDEKCTCIIYRKDRTHPIQVTEYMSECQRNTGPWNSHPKRMLRHKAMMQCARLAFSFSGIYDQDEAERIVYVNKAEDTVEEDNSVTIDQIAETNEDTATAVVTPPEFTIDDVAAMIEKAKNTDAVDEAMDLISGFPKDDRRDEVKRAAIAKYQELQE